ncbi:ABC transporter permease [Cytobacillus horneckiae]|uniref:ABC transporter permease n=1 Tax=Cytobacillus horneckiae TaxID=549687 RepID=UPI003D9A679E
MMKLLQFEIKKIWRQKKLIWIFIIVMMCTAGIYGQNASEQKTKAERATEKITPFIVEISHTQGELRAIEREDQLDESQTEQLMAISDIGSTLAVWKVAINNEQWASIPSKEKEFWTYIEQYEKNGGHFKALQGDEREKAIQKNEWMVTNGLAYDDESYPLSPALVLKHTTEWLFSVLGVIILLLFFGTTITAEREQNTWLTLKTQPISKWKRYGSKYMSLIIMLFVFILLVAIIGLIVPLLIGDYALNLSYPQIIEIGDHFTVISTFRYLLKGTILFICASIFAYSLILLYSAWLKNSFSALILVMTTIFLGFMLTDVYVGWQNIYNPFQFFRFSDLLIDTSESGVFLYLLSSILWSILLSTFAVYLPEKEINFFQGKAVEKPFKQGNIQRRKSTLWNLITFEWRKIYRKGLLGQVCVLLLFLLAFGYFLIYQEAKEKEVAYLHMLENLEEKNDFLPILKEQLTSYQEMKEAGESNPYMDIDWQVTETKKAITLIDEEVKRAKLAFSAYQKENWLPFYEYQLFVNRLNNQEFDTGIVIYDRVRSIGKMSLDASIAEKQWLMEHNVRPVFTGEFVTTISHHWSEDKGGQKNWEGANRRVDSSGMFVLYLYFQHHFYFILMILCLFLVGGGVASEKGKKPPIQFLLTEPLTIRHLFHGKWFMATTVALISSIGIFTIVLLIGTIFNRFGDWKYPILVYDSTSLASTENYTGHISQGMGFHFIPLGEYLIKCVVLYLIVLIFLITLAHFCSLFINNQFSVFSLLLIVTVAGYMVSSEVLTKHAHLSPFTYLNVSKVINGEISTLINNPDITFLTGSVTLLVSTIVLKIIGSIVLMKQKNIVGLKRVESKGKSV